MKYKAVSLAIAVFLTATPIYAQQKSYIVVETPRTTEPTTVITGQPFTQTYVVRFIDLTDSGEQIIVQEESLKSHKILGEFEVLGFYIDKQTKQGEFLEHIWYLHYTLNIVNPKKTEYVIPPLEVPWKHKKAGQEENDPSILVNSDFKTEEVHVNYVTTIPKKDPRLELRDEINLGNFEKQAWVWWVVSWFLRVVLPAFLLAALVVWRRSSRKESKIQDIETDKGVLIGEKTKSPSMLRVWLNLRMSIRRLENCQADLRVKTEIISAIKNYLRTKIPHLSVGSTPLSMVEHISKNVSQYSTEKDALLQLARKAALYQADVEKGKDGYFVSPLAEAKELRRILGRLKLHRRVTLLVRHGFLKARNRLAETWLAEKLQQFGGKR